MIGINSIHASVLQSVGAHLVQKTDIPALLSQIDEDAATCISHHLQRTVKLLTTIAFQTAENVTCDALRMQTNKRCLMGLRIANNHGKMFIAAQFRTEHHNFGIWRTAQWHLGARRHFQALCGSGDIAVHIARFDYYDAVFITNLLMDGWIPRWKACHQCSGDELRNTQ
ncbi:MAG: Uncharacterised protein [SAR116 cluster bacterium]|nr:MAG: Uncharacterised protein [SAR116 cluster bacterium]